MVGILYFFELWHLISSGAGEGGHSPEQLAHISDAINRTSFWSYISREDRKASLASLLIDSIT